MLEGCYCHHTIPDEIRCYSRNVASILFSFIKLPSSRFSTQWMDTVY